MSQAIIFFDFDRISEDPSRRAWSAVTWKVRYALNYKSIPYKTEWVEYPDVESVAIKYGAAPTSKWPDGAPKYTLPMIYDPNTQTAMSETVNIIKYLDTRYPSTPVVLPEWSTALQVAIIDTLYINIGVPFSGILDLNKSGLSPRSIAHLQKKYGPVFTGYVHPLNEKEMSTQLQALEGGFNKVADWLRANGPGKEDLLMGTQICLADFQIAALLVSIRNLFGEESEVWQKVCAWHDGKWKRYLEQFSAYASVDI